MMPHRTSRALKLVNPSLRAPFWGLQSTIANRLGVTRPMVCQVWNGQKRSQRIEAEIKAALRNPARYLRLYSVKAA